MPSSVVFIALGASVLVVLGLQMLMSRKGPVWAGGVLPTLLAVAAVTLIVQGRFDTGRSYVVALAAIVMLVWIWINARQRGGRSGASALTSAVGRES